MENTSIDSTFLTRLTLLSDRLTLLVHVCDQLLLGQHSRESEVFVGSLTVLNDVRGAKLPLDSDLFMRTLIRELATSLEDVVGVEEASGFISVVGQRVGDSINEGYRKALKVDQLSEEQVASVLVDLKARINGDFFIISADHEKLVFGNRVCPFGDKVLGRTSMCMMTSNVFGSIAAENLGRAKVVLEQTIAQGDNGCRVVVYLKDSDESNAQEGRRYFRRE